MGLLSRQEISETLQTRPRQQSVAKAMVMRETKTNYFHWRGSERSTFRVLRLLGVPRACLRWLWGRGVGIRGRWCFDGWDRRRDQFGSRDWRWGTLTRRWIRWRGAGMRTVNKALGPSGSVPHVNGRSWAWEPLTRRRYKKQRRFGPWTSLDKQTERSETWFRLSRHEQVVNALIPFELVNWNEGYT